MAPPGIGSRHSPEPGPDVQQSILSPLGFSVLHHTRSGDQGQPVLVFVALTTHVSDDVCTEALDLHRINA